MNEQMLRAGIVLLLLLVIYSSLIGCAQQTDRSAHTMNEPRLVDNPIVYENDDPSSVRVLYMTITESNLSKPYPILWSLINSPLTIDKATDAYMIADAIVQEGSEAGLEAGMFGAGDTHPNATVRVRGNSTRTAEQKSYRIKLKDSAGLWQDQKSLNLIKHAYDTTRVANALSLDYYRLIPDITSLRKQFVHLYVKDESAQPPQAEYVDYGLYEHVEHPNKSYLRSHGLDPTGHFYKAIEFEFYRYPEQLKLKSDPGYSLEAFESILQIEGNEDHSKLLQMLDDVNNYDLNFDEVFDRYFDRDNFFTWLGSNILFDNIDTITQNFLLYSPNNSEKWFFLPWDLDGGWGNDTGNGRGWHLGIANYWSSVVVQRLFANSHNIDQLNDKIRELKQVITPTQTKAFLEQYRKVVPEYVSRQPDNIYLDATMEEFNARWESLITLPDEMEQLYFDSLELPMPFYLGEVSSEDGSLHFYWDPSFDLQGDIITYQFALSRDPHFRTILYSIGDLSETEHSIAEVEPGIYYWRVIAIDNKGNQQFAFDEYIDENEQLYYGIRQLQLPLQ